MKRPFYILTVIILLISCSGKSPTQADNEPVRGDIQEITAKGSVPAGLIATTFALAGAENIWPMPYDVETYKVIYWTEDPRGDLTLASAALMLPVTDQNLPLISIQHGTEILRTSAASNGAFLSLEGAWGLAAAARGYAALVPDYLGLGVSEMIHPYHLAVPTANTVIDAIRAARQYCQETNIPLDHRLFLTGYSEGGYATMAAHRTMQLQFNQEFTITASAPMAGAYNLKKTARYLISQNNNTVPTYAALLLTAYNRYHGWSRLSEIFQPPYDGQVESLLDGSQSFAQVKRALPASLDLLLTDTFRQTVADSSDADIESALAENTLLDWAPVCPTRLFHGLSDMTVPAFNSTAALHIFLLMGAPDVQLITYPGLDHAGAALPAVTAGMLWFENFWPES